MCSVVAWPLLKKILKIIVDYHCPTSLAHDYLLFYNNIHLKISLCFRKVILLLHLPWIQTKGSRTIEIMVIDSAFVN